MLRNGRLKICRECTKKDAARRTAMGPCEKQEECKGCIQTSSSIPDGLELQIWCPKCFGRDGKGLLHLPVPCAKLAATAGMEGTCTKCHHVFCLSAAGVGRIVRQAKTWRGQIFPVYPANLLHVTGEGQTCKGCEDDEKAAALVEQQKQARLYWDVDYFEDMD